jgi:uncharacterized protein (TIGR02001 family)
MRFSMISLGALALATIATPAFAQEEAPEPFTITGGATVVSDYRFRGFSQSNEEAAIQGTFTIAHESGLYLGTWGSSIGFANGTEIDVYAGYATEITSGVTADIGATLYLYPGTTDTTVIEPYLALTGTVGPVKAKVGVAYAPGGQNALADFSGIYGYTDLAAAIPSTPLTLKGHVGYSESDSFLGGFDGNVFDYSVGIDVTWKVLTLGVSYVNTDAPKTFGYKEAIGADGAVLFSLGAAF